MKTKTIVATMSLLACALSLLAQGSLTPPGAPAATMRTLDEIYSKVEARTPINTNTTPGDAFNSFIISQSGSYYLTSNIFGAAGKDGIKIATNNVTLDLNGFSVFGSSTSGNANGGIYLPFATVLNTVTIRNGTVSGWTGSGLVGISCYARNAFLEHLTISTNNNGIFCINDSIIKDCIFNGNVGHGLDVNGSGSIIVNNIFIGNNTGNSSGIGSLEVFGSNNRVEGNHVTGSGVPGSGIFISVFAVNTNNIVIRNSVEGGGTNNYSFNANQIVGPIITNTVSGIITNSNPWANFSF